MRRLVFAIATIVVSPVLLWQFLGRLVFDRDSLLEGSGQLLSAVPGRVGVLLRAAFYHRVLEFCHPTVWVGYGSLISKSGTRLGEHVYIGPYCLLGLVTIEQDTLLGPSVQIPSGQRIHHFDRLDIPIRAQGGVVERVTIGADCWIGGGSVVMADVGAGSVIGAGSVVTKPIPGGVIAVGSPAKFVRSRSG